MRKLVLLLLALAALPFAQLKAGNDCSCGGIPMCSITVSGYEVRVTGCNFRNYFGGTVQFFGDTADDRYGNWTTRYLPAEKMDDLAYYAVATFWHNYTVRGTGRPEGEVRTYLVWERWESGGVAYSLGSVVVRVEYPQFGWTWETGRPGEVVKHDPPNHPPTYGGSSDDWKDFASGPAKSFSSDTVVVGSGWIAGWLGYSVWRSKVRGAFYLHGQVVQPLPPKPDSVSVWARDAATGRALLNASVGVCWRGDYCVGMYCSNRTTPTGQRGCGFNLKAYSSSGLWLARTDAGWYYYDPIRNLRADLQYDSLGRYLIPRDVYNIKARVYSPRLSGPVWLVLQMSGKDAAIIVELENPPGSDNYVEVARGEIDGSGSWSYSNRFQLSSQRFRIRFYDLKLGLPGEASGWVLVAEPIQGAAQPAGWEVYKGSDLVIKTSSAETGWFGAYEGNSYTAIAVYSLQRKLAVKLVKPDGTPAYGAWIKVDGVEYSDCADGRCDGVVTVSVGAGPHTVEVLDTYYNKTVAERGLWSATSTTYNQRYHWQRYAFWKWSDGDASNPRTVTVNQDTTLTAYVWDEKRLWVLYEPRYGSDPWGVKAVSLPSRYAGYTGKMVPYGSDFWLRPGESFTLQAVEAGAARFLRWEIGTECYPRNPYSTSPVITLTVGSYGLAVKAVFRLGPSNQTMFLPGEGIPNPVFWPVYQQYAMGGCDGRKGAWLLNVTALTSQAQDAFNLDSRVWIYALLVNPSSTLETAWVPVNGSWRLYMDRDWDAAAHKLDDCTLDDPYADACRYAAYDANSVSDFPQVVSGAPSAYRGWRLVALAAWRPLLPGDSYSAGAIGAVWSGTATYALYNVTFKHVDSGWVYWQPVAVSALKIESAVARYKLSSYDSQLRRSPIYMWIEAVVDWAFAPPNVTLPTLPPNVTLWMAGFKPSRVGNVGVALENSAGVAAWAPRGSAYGATGKLYTLAIGDTELFYREPRGLNFGARAFRLVARFVARAGQPGVRVDDGVPVKAEVGFTLAPSNTIIADWLGNDPWKLVIDWDCFRSGREPFGTSRMGVNYRADLYYEWGPVDPYEGTLPPLGRRSFTGVYPTVLVSDVDPDYWVAFYPVPAGNQYPVAPNSVVPVPLYTKFPPRAKGG